MFMILYDLERQSTMSIDLHQKQKHTKVLSTYRYQKNKATILEEIKTTITHTLAAHPTSTTAESFQHIIHSIQNTIEKHEKRPKPRRKPWCTARHKRLIKKQHELYQIAINNPHPDHTRRHRTFRNQLKKTIQKAQTKTTTGAPAT